MAAAREPELLHYCLFSFFCLLHEVETESPTNPFCYQEQGPLLQGGEEKEVEEEEEGEFDFVRLER